MFDTMTITKAVAAITSTLLFFLLAGWAADELYFAEHGEHEQSYVIDTGEAGGAGVAEEVEVVFADVLAEADAAKGAKVFKKCTACHKLEDGANATGPYLSGVVGRPAGTATGFAYSDAIAALGGAAWTPEALNEFLASPKGYAPGNKMSFAGLKKITDRANLVAYLQQQGG
jgi:cytochrome c